MQPNGPSPDRVPEQADSSKTPALAAAVQAAEPRLDVLPPYRVLLHNDAHNDMVYVVESICDLTPLPPQRAAAVMLEAHRTGVGLMLVTHRERAELYVEQFASRDLKVTMEPTE
jgi:ATP-dependent Clp protease adaptor protein ClpS